MHRPISHMFLAVLPLAMGLGLGCASGGGNPPPEASPNLYQTFEEDLSTCSKVQHEWIDSEGNTKTQIVDQAKSCSYVDAPSGLRARCVVLDDTSDRIVWASSWVEAEITKDFMRFMSLCPDAEVPSTN